VRNVIFGAPYAVMFTVTITAVAMLRRYRRPLEEATRDLKSRIRAHDALISDVRQIAPLGEWASRMNVTVISNTGEDFTMSFMEFHASEAAGFRCWNSPRSVTLWATDDDIAEAAQTVRKNEHG
jgi:hypothetical protein